MIKLPLADPKPGDRFGRLTIIEQHPDNKYFWNLECSCGNIVTQKLSHLRGKSIKSCGCLKGTPLQKQHGHSTHPLYETWRGMHNRCKNKTIRYYGRKGITVCERWNDFILFLADMGEKPSPEYTLDRKASKGNYELGNCKWSTRKEQALNRCNNVRV